MLCVAIMLWMLPYIHDEMYICKGSMTIRLNFKDFVSDSLKPKCSRVAQNAANFSPALRQAWLQQCRIAHSHYQSPIPSCQQLQQGAPAAPCIVTTFIVCQAGWYHPTTRKWHHQDFPARSATGAKLDRLPEMLLQNVQVALTVESKA